MQPPSNERPRDQVGTEVATRQEVGLVPAELSVDLAATEGGRLAVVGMLKGVFLDVRPMAVDQVTKTRGLDKFLEGCTQAGIAIEDPAVRAVLRDKAEVFENAEAYHGAFKAAFELFGLSGEAPEETTRRFVGKGSQRIAIIRDRLTEYRDGKIEKIDKTEASDGPGGRMHFRAIYLPDMEDAAGRETDLFDACGQLPAVDDMLVCAETAFALYQEEPDERHQGLLRTLRGTLSCVAEQYALHLVRHADGYAENSTYSKQEILDRAAPIIRHFAYALADKDRRDTAEEKLALIGEELPADKYPKPGEEPLEERLKTYDLDKLFNMVFEPINQEDVIGDPDPDMPQRYVRRQGIPAELLRERAVAFREWAVADLQLSKNHGHLKPYSPPIELTLAKFAMAALLESEAQPIEKPFVQYAASQGREYVRVPDMTLELARSLVDRDTLVSAAKGRLQVEKEVDHGQALMRYLEEATFLLEAAEAIVSPELLIVAMRNLNDEVTAWDDYEEEAVIIKRRQRAAEVMGGLGRLWSTAINHTLQIQAKTELEAGEAEQRALPPADEVN